MARSEIWDRHRLASQTQITLRSIRAALADFPVAEKQVGTR
jgi:hypothetical protein